MPDEQFDVHRSPDEPPQALHRPGGRRRTPWFVGGGVLLALVAALAVLLVVLPGEDDDQPEPPGTTAPHPDDLAGRVAAVCGGPVTPSATGDATVECDGWTYRHEPGTWDWAATVPDSLPGSCSTAPPGTTSRHELRTEGTSAAVVICSSAPGRHLLAFQVRGSSVVVSRETETTTLFLNAAIGMEQLIDGFARL